MSADFWFYLRLYRPVRSAFLMTTSAVSVAAMDDVEKQIDALAAKYERIKSMPDWMLHSAATPIRDAVDELKTYLNAVAWPNTNGLLTAPKSSKGLLHYTVKMQLATLARTLLVKIDILQDSDQLPSAQLPWDRRRSKLASQRDALKRLTLTLEHASRLMATDVAVAEAAEQSLRGTASDPFITQEELTMLDQDWKDWVAAEGKAREYKNFFHSLARASLEIANVLSKRIEAGDAANASPP